MSFELYSVSLVDAPPAGTEWATPADLAEARTVAPSLRSAFLHLRAGTRRILADHVGRVAALGRIVRDCSRCGTDAGHGRPRLEGWQGSFSVSYGGDLGLIAISSDLVVGTDVERIEPIQAWEMAGVLSPSEWAALVGSGMLPDGRSSAYAPDARWACLLQLWTAKEAVLKARGHGLLASAGRIEVAGRLLEGERRIVVDELVVEPIPEHRLSAEHVGSVAYYTKERGGTTRPEPGAPDLPARVAGDPPSTHPVGRVLPPRPHVRARCDVSQGWRGSMETPASGPPTRHRDGPTRESG